MGRRELVSTVRLIGELAESSPGRLLMKAFAPARARQSLWYVDEGFLATSILVFGRQLFSNVSFPMRLSRDGILLIRLALALARHMQPNYGVLLHATPMPGLSLVSAHCRYAICDTRIRNIIRRMLPRRARTPHPLVNRVAYILEHELSEFSDEDLREGVVYIGGTVDGGEAKYKLREFKPLLSTDYRDIIYTEFLGVIERVEGGASGERVIAYAVSLGTLRERCLIEARC